MPLPHTPLGSSNSSSDAHERESYLQTLELAWMMGAKVEVEVRGKWVPVPNTLPDGASTALTSTSTSDLSLEALNFAWRMGAELEVWIADYWYPVVPCDGKIHAHLNHRHVYRLKESSSSGS